MINIAHASSRERCQLILKAYRKAKKERKLHWNTLEEEERQEIEKARNAPDSIAVIVRRLLWDYEHKQLPVCKYKMFADKIDEYLKTNPKDEAKYRKLRGDLGVF